MSGMKDFFGNLFGKGQKPDTCKPAGNKAKQNARQYHNVESQDKRDIYQPGDVIGGKYEVHRKLGKGGFGIVYLVSNRGTKEVAALKTFRDEFLIDGRAREAFKKEALLWVNLEDHPFILAARLVEEFSGRLFVTMDFVAPDQRGCVSIEDHLRRSRGPWDIKQVLKWSIQFCYGMEHANVHGIKVHRDIKPANILIMQDGTLKIADFGLAAGAVVACRGGKTIVSVSADGRPGCSLLQAEGKGWCGTPGYAAPEVYEGKDADVHSDIYSFGVVLWQMAKGNPFSPFHSSEVQYRGNDQTYIMEYQQKVYQKQMAGRVPSVDGPLQSVIERCLAFERSGRYHDFKSLRLELEPIFEQLTGRHVLIPKAGEKTSAFWSNKGHSLDSLGRYQEAISCYNKAIEIDPRHAMAWNNKGVSLDFLGRYQEAISCYDKALEIDPLHAMAWNNKGIILHSLGRYQEAIICYDNVLEIGPQEADAWNNKSGSLHSLGRYQEAISCCDKAIEIDPRYAMAWNNKGISLHSLDRYQEAISCCDKALEIDPRYAYAWYTKALSEEKVGRTKEAAKSYRKFIECAPTQYAQQIVYSRQQLKELE
jgi:tetratricopeptide (TPR) repeat protein